jgi:hypothetical protein
MGRIIGNSSSVSGETYPLDPVEVADDFRETAGRLRTANDRPNAMHETSDSMVDSRNTARVDTSDFEYTRPTNLQAPKPRPGFAQRWIRADLRSEADNNNWQLKMREGWMPRDPATVPDAEVFFGVHQHKGQGVIRVGGLVLCEMDERRVRAKRDYIRSLTKAQEDSVREETDKISREGVRQGHSPIVREDETRVSTGRRPATMAD